MCIRDRLYTECHALAVFGAMEGGAARKENLIALYTLSLIHI